jgi:hypothetical protein
MYQVACRSGIIHPLCGVRLESRSFVRPSDGEAYNCLIAALKGQTKKGILDIVSDVFLLVLQESQIP